MNGEECVRGGAGEGGRKKEAEEERKWREIKYSFRFLIKVRAGFNSYTRLCFIGMRSFRYACKTRISIEASGT